MVVRKLNKEEFCLVLQRIIFRLGADRTLRRDISDRQLYSGPEWQIGQELQREFHKAGLVYFTNKELAEKQAARENAVRIDDTYIGRVLNNQDLRRYFFEVYQDRDQAIDAEYAVWAYASRAFVAAGSGQALTASCGASEFRVYRREELDEMAKLGNFKTINDKVADAELEIFRRDKAKFQRHTSLIELRRSLKAAQGEVLKHGSTSIATEYFRRKEFYLLQRRNELMLAGKNVPRAYALSFEERRMREATFLLEILDFQPYRPSVSSSIVSARAVRS